MSLGSRILVAGGAGFIGGHLVRRLLAETDARVVVLDNFCSGTEWRLAESLATGRVEVVRADLKDLDAVEAALDGCDHAFHLAANPDIAKAVADPTVDFWEGTYLTQNLVEAVRRQGVPRVTYTSGSGVYGDLGDVPVVEDLPPRPISPYGASKLACEAMLSAYAHMFGLHVGAFRFANVVGPRQTHGVAYDFIRKLRKDPARLEIMGDGSQSKSYVHVDDVVSALLMPGRDGWQGFDVCNVATEDYVTVREIADLVCERMGLTGVEYAFGESPRGWKGDVPVVRFDSQRIRARGWRNTRTSVEALAHSIDSMLEEPEDA